MGLLCALIGHYRRKAKVWHDTSDWRSECKRCGVSMIRDHRLNKWRPFDDRDRSPKRTDPPASGVSRTRREIG
jgi:hypothetical protein